RRASLSAPPTIPPLLLFLSFSPPPPHHQDLHPFPTRRSSDLKANTCALRVRRIWTYSIRRTEVMMIDPPIDKLIKKAECRYALTDRKSTRLTPVTFRPRMPSSA